MDDTPAENGWVYRRWNTFITKLLVFVLVGICVAIMGALNQPLLWVTLSLVIYAIIMDGLYMGGASVLDYAEVAKAWKIGKIEVPDVVTNVLSGNTTTTPDKEE